MSGFLGRTALGSIFCSKSSGGSHFSEKTSNVSFANNGWNIWRVRANSHAQTSYRLARIEA